jgi:hypothetical protein
MRCHHIKDPNLGRACVASQLEKGAKSVKVVRRVVAFRFRFLGSQLISS